MLAALERRESDRVPIDLGSFHDAALPLDTHRQVADLLGEPFDGYHLYDWTLGMVFPDDGLLRRFHVDTRNVRTGRGSTATSRASTARSGSGRSTTGTSASSRRTVACS